MTRRRGIAAAGVDELRVLRFDARLAGSWRRSIHRARPGRAHEGEARGDRRGIPFRQGARRRRRGCCVARAARRLCSRRRRRRACPAARPVSSTRVREALAAGRMDEARALLGRDFRISGRVIAGEKLGRELGFPHRQPAPAPARVAGRRHLRGARLGRRARAPRRRRLGRHAADGRRHRVAARGASVRLRRRPVRRAARRGVRRAAARRDPVRRTSRR